MQYIRGRGYNKENPLFPGFYQLPSHLWDGHKYLKSAPGFSP